MFEYFITIQIPIEAIQSWLVARKNMPYIETSAKDNLNVSKAFEIAVDEVLKRTVEGATCPESNTSLPPGEMRKVSGSPSLWNVAQGQQQTPSFHPSLKGGIFN